MARSPNANPAKTGFTGLALTYACVTMVDVAEGDCYVVDIKQRPELGDADPKGWNRYLLDMGAEKKVAWRMAGMLRSLYNADYNTDTGGNATKKKKKGEKDPTCKIVLGGPWEVPGKITTAMPPMSGVFITHSDADHCGNATRVLSDYVRRSGTTDDNNCITNYTLPVFLSPMWQWTMGVIVDTAAMLNNWCMLEEFCIIRATALTSQVNGQHQLDDVWIEVEHRDTPRSGGATARQTWRNLKDLVDQAGYRLVYRFNYIGILKPDVAESFSSVHLKRLEDHFEKAKVEGEVNFSDSPTRRLTRLGKSNATIEALAEAEKNNKNAVDPEKLKEGTAPAFTPSTAPKDLEQRKSDTLLIEVGFQAKSNFLVRRTLSNETTNSLITGHWLRTAIRMKEIAGRVPMEVMQKKSKRDATDEEKKVNGETSPRRTSGGDTKKKKKVKSDKFGGRLNEDNGDQDKDDEDAADSGPRPARIQSYRSFNSLPSGSIQILNPQRALQHGRSQRQEKALQDKILSMKEVSRLDFLLGVPRDRFPVAGTNATSLNFEINSRIKYVASRYYKEEAAPEGGNPDEKKDDGDPEDKDNEADKDEDDDDKDDDDGKSNGKIELENTHLPVDYHLIGLDDELRQLPFPRSEVASRMVRGADKSITKKPEEFGALRTGGHFSESRFGCAGRTYVRDLVHLTLQHRLPNTEKLDKDKILKRATDFTQAKKDKADQNQKTAAANKTLQDNYDKAVLSGAKPDKPKLKALVRSRLSRVSDALQTLGLEALQNPKLWAEYANRASIITHFVYKEKPWDEAVPPKRTPGTGNFNMLFTGDAFEAGRDESINTPDRRYEFESNWVPHSASDFSNHIADGNLLAWLWKQNLFTSLRVDVLKLPHHGSSVTTAFSFFRQVSASVYLISASAAIHNHPRAEALKAIVATVLQEDGPARPPSEFSRKGNKRSGKDCISKRRRPRLVFMTNAAKYPDDKRYDRACEKVYDWFLTKKLWPREQGSNNEKLEKLFNDEVARYIHGDPTDAKFNPGFKNEMFGCDWLRDCPNLRMQPTPPSAAAQQAGSANGDQEKEKKKREIPLANIRFFYQREPDAATRLRFGRDKNRPDEVRVEWHAEDWVEMRYEWDEQDLNVHERGAPWYTLDKEKWKTEPRKQGSLDDARTAAIPHYQTYLDILNGNAPSTALNTTQTKGTKDLYSWYLRQLKNAMRLQDPKYGRPVQTVDPKPSNPSQAVPDPKTEKRKSLAELYKNIVDDPLAYPYYKGDAWETPAESSEIAVE